MPRPRLLIVAHDAGGAEIVSSWLQRHRDDWDPELVLDGPAVAVFGRKLGDDVRSRAELPPLEGVAFMLCGSSGAATLERRAVRSARTAGVRCAVWLDHWVNYAMRFELDGTRVLPDEVWVGDEHAAVLARAELPGADVRLQGNPYLEDFVAEVHELGTRTPAGDAERILYVTEPTSIAEPALERYLDWLAARGGRAVELRLRTHPAEPPDKYDALLARHAGLSPRVSRGSTLAEDVAWADTVAGCDTMAMFAAARAGRRVVSVLPEGVAARLPPDAGIERLWADARGAA
jgi:hypothetical protein